MLGVKGSHCAFLAVATCLTMLLATPLANPSPIPNCSRTKPCLILGMNSATSSEITSSLGMNASLRRTVYVPVPSSAINSEECESLTPLAFALTTDMTRLPSDSSKIAAKIWLGPILDTHGKRPETRYPPDTFSPLRANFSMPEKDFMGLDRPVPPSCSPPATRSRRRFRKPVFSLEAKYQTSASWHQVQNPVDMQTSLIVAISATAAGKPVDGD